MNAQKRKFELFARLQTLGFTYDEAAALRRIEMTLKRWAELECGDGKGYIMRDELTGQPFYINCRTSYLAANDPRARSAIPDREAGALRRLAAIVKARNERAFPGKLTNWYDHPQFVTAYHQCDCRGCMLYLLTREQLNDWQTGEALPADQYYNWGLAVCA